MNTVSKLNLFAIILIASNIITDTITLSQFPIQLI